MKYNNKTSELLFEIKQKDQDYFYQTQLLNSLLGHLDQNNITWLIEEKKITKFDKIDTAIMPQRLKKEIENFCYRNIINLGYSNEENLENNQNSHFFIDISSLLFFCDIDESIIYNLQDTYIEKESIRKKEIKQDNYVFENDERITEILEKDFLTALAFYYDNPECLVFLEKKEQDFFVDKRFIISNQLKEINRYDFSKAEQGYPQKSINKIIDTIESSTGIAGYEKYKSMMLPLLIDIVLSTNSKDKEYKKSFFKLIKKDYMDTEDIYNYLSKKTLFFEKTIFKFINNTSDLLEEYDKQNKSKNLEDWIWKVFIENEFLSEAFRIENFNKKFYEMVKNNIVSCPFYEPQLETLEIFEGVIDWPAMVKEFSIAINLKITESKNNIKIDNPIILEQVFPEETDMLFEDNKERLFAMDKNNDLLPMLEEAIENNLIERSPISEKIIMELKHKNKLENKRKGPIL